MRSANHFVIAVFVLLILSGSESLTAQKLRMPFRKSTAPSPGQRDLTSRDGPWLIMCFSFTGEQAEELARKLAGELRQDRLQTYLYRHSFDYSGTVTGLGWERPDEEGNFEPIKMKSANREVVQEVAVLVGDFPSPDDGNAQKTLNKIKSMQITSIPEFAAKPPGQNSAGRSGSRQEKARGPLRTAFLLPNPLLPDDYFRQDKVDDFIVKLNRNVEHSLLNCPGVYSVKIASFRGESTIDPSRIKQGESELEFLQRTGKPLASSRLAEAEEKAHTIAKALRKKGVEAYEFHDRHESMVCIGSFDWVTRESEGTTLNNPEIVRIVNKCKPEIKDLPGIPGAIIPKSIQGIPLDPEPVPILVPRVDEKRTAGALNFLRR